MKTLTKKELKDALGNIKDDLPVYVYAAYNCYEIQNFIVTNDAIIINVGEINNESAIEIE